MFGRVPDSVKAERRNRDALAAAKMLLAVDGVLSHYPTPVALLRSDCSVIAANTAANRAGTIFGLGGDIGLCLAAALAAGRPASETITTGAPEESGAAWKLTVVPFDGEDAAFVFSHDVSREHALRTALAESRQRYKDLVGISSDFAWETGPDGCFIFVSPAGALDRPAEEFLGRRPEEFLVETVAAEAHSLFSARSPASDADTWMRRADGGASLIRISAVPVFDGAGAWCGARGMCRDVTAERERDDALARAQTREKLIAYVVRAAHDEIDPRRTLLAIATAIARALGGAGCCIYRARPGGGFELAADYGRPDGLSAIEDKLLARAAEHEEEVVSDDSDDRILSISTSYRKSLNGAMIVAPPADVPSWGEDTRDLVADVALQLAVAIEQSEYHDRLEALSRTDELTGLLNRRAFFSEIEGRISRMVDGMASSSLFFVDLDNFKAVNDVHGHKRGDEALDTIAKLLTGKTRPADLIARLGGDEFALWMDRTDEASSIQRARDMLAESDSLQAYSGGADKPLGFSLGIAVYVAGSDESVSGIIARADAAMYEIKHGGKGGFVVAPQFGDSAEAAGPDGDS